MRLYRDILKAIQHLILTDKLIKLIQRKFCHKKTTNSHHLLTRCIKMDLSNRAKTLKESTQKLCWLQVSKPTLNSVNLKQLKIKWPINNTIAPKLIKRILYALKSKKMETDWSLFCIDWTLCKQSVDWIESMKKFTKFQIISKYTYLMPTYQKDLSQVAIKSRSKLVIKL